MMRKRNTNTQVLLSLTRGATLLFLNDSSSSFFPMTITYLETALL